MYIHFDATPWQKHWNFVQIKLKPKPVTACGRVYILGLQTSCKDYEAPACLNF